MKEVIADIERWRAAGMRVAVARVVGVLGSGPRAAGATMVVNEAGEVAGSVSGGCVEGAVVAEALDAMQSDKGARRHTFGYSDDEAFAVGLTCGGTLHILVDPDLSDVYEPLRDALEHDRPVALATVAGLVEGVADGVGSVGDANPVLGDSLLVDADGNVTGSLGSPELDEAVTRDASGALANGLSSTRRYGCQGEVRPRTVEVFIEVFAPPPRMIIFGAVDFTGALVKVAKVLGYNVTVCDARPVFATAARFPAADEVVADQPGRFLAAVGSTLGPRDAVCVLTHDPKWDVPAIMGALGTKVGYLGAMGSRRTHANRLKRLSEQGVDPQALTRLMAPIGLDIGARTPEETAVAICAEIITIHTGRHGPSLRDSSGPIHVAPLVTAAGPSS